jgi:hypothetical protein
MLLCWDMILAFESWVPRCNEIENLLFKVCWIEKKTGIACNLLSNCGRKSFDEDV